MSKPKNPAIGTVPCPVAGCSCSCEVRKFATRAKSDGARRWGGRWYLDCPEHGRFGQDCRPALQDYIAEKATIWGPEGKPASSAAAPVRAEEPRELIALPSGPPPKPAPMPAPKATAPKAAPINLFAWGK